MEMSEDSTKTKKLTAKEQRFVDYYIVRFNASQAARDAGYSPKSATEIGHENLRKPHIQEAIQKRLKEENLGKSETEKMITDIAKADLNRYFKKIKRKREKEIKVPLPQVIARIKREIEIEEEFSRRVKMDGKRRAQHKNRIDGMKENIIRMEILLERDPDAYRTETEMEEVDDVVLDLVALTQDKEAGRIKKFGYDKYGNPEIELYSADSALINIAKINGLLVDKKQITGNVQINKAPDLSQLTDEELEVYASIAEKLGMVEDED
ncbi:MULTISPECIES: terminase small subunit [Olivibacter]|uniref:Terminase small subunit n=1 Tax=Olivibacter jilunii TaxID=985016 RepID=A0ABW6AXP5_9SPHI